MTKASFLLISTALVASASSNYTYVFSNTKNIQNAKAFINKNLKDSKDNIYIVKHNDRYRVTMGTFSSKKQASEFKKQLPYKFKKLDKFISKKDDKNIVKSFINKQEMIKPIMSNNTMKHNEVVKSEVFKKPEKKIVLNEKDVKKQKVAKKLEKKEEVKTVKKEKKLVPVNKKSDLKFLIDMTYFPVSIENSFKTTTSTDINTKKDLGLDSYKHILVPKIYLNYNNHYIYTSYLGLEEEGTTTLQKALTFNGTNYNIGDTVTSNYKTSWYTSGYRYKYKDLKIGVDVHDYTNRLSVNGSKLKKEYLFPALAFDMRHDFNAFALMYGGSYGQKSDEVKLYDYYLGIGMDEEIFNSTVSLGYKAKELDIKDNIYDGDSKYQGGYINFTKEF